MGRCGLIKKSKPGFFQNLPLPARCLWVLIFGAEKTQQIRKDSLNSLCRLYGQVIKITIRKMCYLNGKKTFVAPGRESRQDLCTPMYKIYTHQKSFPSVSTLQFTVPSTSFSCPAFRIIVCVCVLERMVLPFPLGLPIYVIKNIPKSRCISFSANILPLVYF